MKLKHGSKWENPPAGPVVATVIDIYEQPNQNTQRGPQDRLRIVWAIANAMTGQPILGKDPKNEKTFNKPLTYSKGYNAALSVVTAKKKTDLTVHLEQILGGPVPMFDEVAQLEQAVLGRSHNLFLVEAVNPSDPTSPYINISGISPLQPGQVAPQAPQGFVRERDRSRTQTGPNGQPVQTYSQPPQQAPVATQPAQQAPAPAPNNNLSF
jgi:hypothetical protein